MADSNKAFITKLNNDNYFMWKYKMELLLMKEKLWSVLNEIKPEPTGDNANAEAINNWQIRDDQARAWIGLSVEDNQLCYIRNKTTAKDAWTALKTFHEKDSMTNKMSIIRRICGLKMSEGGNVGEHLNELTNLFQKLNDLGEKQLSNTWHVGVIVSSLPRSYDNLIVALEARPEADVTLSLVQSKLITEYQRRKEADGNENTDSALKTTAKFKDKIKCFFCKRSGHVKSDCSKYKSWKIKHTIRESASTSDKINKVEENDSFLFVVSSKENCDGWILDSGATKHISSNKSFFVSLDQAECKSLNVANGESVDVKGKGVCRIEMVNANGVSTVATVTDVLYVPNIQGNLLSVKKLLEKGYAVNFIPNSETCEIKFGDKQVAVADAQSNLFKLRQPNKVYAVREHKENCIHHWHRIFGHRDPDAIKQMYSKGLVNGMKIVDCGIKVKCEVCLKGKTTRLPFPKQSLTKSTAPLDLIHTDVCGPMQTVSPSGKRYILVFIDIDDFSRYTVIYLLKNKSEVDEKIKEYVALVKNKFSTKPKVIRSDRGGEYTGKNVVDFLKHEGIQIQYTTPYTPQQNGVAERKNRTLIEMARCMLLEANLSKTFWAEAVNTANYIQNRLPCRAIEKTPYEAWNQRKPGIEHFSIFGAKCFVHVPSERRRKLDDTSAPMIFVGYDENSKGFRCFDPVKNKLVISRDVRFTEKSASEIRVDLSSSDANVESSTIGIDMDKSTEINPNVRDNVSDTVTIENNTGVCNNSGDAVSNVEFESFAEGLHRIFNEENNRDIPIHEASVHRTSQREKKGVPPRRLIDEIDMVYKVVEPKSLSEALSSEHKEQWIRAMKNEIDSLKKNETWQLCELPKGRKAIGCKWVYKVKTDADGKIDRHKARLVAQGFSQKYGTDYDQVFAPVARHDKQHSERFYRLHRKKNSLCDILMQKQRF